MATVPAGSPPSGAVVGTTDTQTLTNKTLTAPIIADFTNAAHDHGDADDGGTLVVGAYPTMVGDSGSGGTKGAVPAPASGDAAAGKFLKADATWAVPAGGGGGGDFSSNTSSSVDGEVVLFSGTGGKTGKRATGSGIAILTSGVLSVTSAPTFTDFTNAPHDHGDADDGGLTFAMVPAATLSGRRITPYRIVPFNSFSTLAMAANTLYGFPVWLRKGESLGALSVDVTAFAAVFARMGLYAFDPATGMGGARLWDAGAVSVNTSNGWKDATSGANYAVPESGLYIAAIVSDGTPTVRSLGGHVAQSAVFGQDQTTGSASVQVGHSIAFTAGANCANALPDPFGSASFIATGSQVALVFPRLA